MEKYEIDSIDKKILNLLSKNARMPYLEIARQLIVSGGTIHQRIDKMKEAGIITGSHLSINLEKLGYDVTVFLGIHLSHSNKLNQVIKQLTKLPEVVELNYTTGNYALLAKIKTHNIQDFHIFLTQKLQTIEGIQSTESSISLSQPINRNIQL